MVAISELQNSGKKYTFPVTNKDEYDKLTSIGLISLSRYYGDHYYSINSGGYWASSTASAKDKGQMADECIVIELDDIEGFNKFKSSGDYSCLIKLLKRLNIK